MIKRVTYSVEGNILSALTVGNPTHPTAIFLHGIPASSELWRKVMVDVSRNGFFCIAPDLPGYGKTRVKQDSYYSLKGAAELLLSWIKENGFQNIWLIGHDIGGGVAQIMMTRDEDLFKHVSLSNAATANTWPVAIIRIMRWLARYGWYQKLAKWGLVALIGKTYLKKGFTKHKQLHKGLLEKIFFDGKVTEEDGRDKFASHLKSLNNKETALITNKMQEVEIFVHLIWGMKDPFQPWTRAGLFLALNLKRYKVTKLEDAGHFLQLYQPDWYTKALIKGWNWSIK